MKRFYTFFERIAVGQRISSSGVVVLYDVHILLSMRLNRMNHRKRLKWFLKTTHGFQQLRLTGAIADVPRRVTLVDYAIPDNL